MNLKRGDYIQVEKREGEILSLVVDEVIDGCIYALDGDGMDYSIMEDEIVYFENL